MASRAFSRRLFASALRAPAAVRPAAGRRLASTSAEHGAKQSSDTPWMIGSALVFGPIALYLLTTQGKEKGKHSADGHHARAAKAHAPSEQSIQKEEPAPEPASEEAPKDEQPAEQTDSSSDGKLHGAQPMTDSEGTTVSAEEIDGSMKQAFVRTLSVSRRITKANVPEDAQRAEENDAKFADGAPGQTAEAETKPDQKEKPGHHHAGTLQSDDDSGPTNMGDAREKATSKEAPKQAAQDSD
ncbi:hypothetical protein BN946_scf184975.g8 [Trametes cinnabarina]|uniref:Uncharacterized protein n=1 Tax=Pycnoporus cinnabarinus TaxID=5643 RepID=A0A060SWU5_PYCCI|nr:hypothetical protein BN946_scf184975.g8 [Trametes cinnabarina]